VEQDLCRHIGTIIRFVDVQPLKDGLEDVDFSSAETVPADNGTQGALKHSGNVNNGDWQNRKRPQNGLDGTLQRLKMVEDPRRFKINKKRFSRGDILILFKNRMSRMMMMMIIIIIIIMIIIMIIMVIIIMIIIK